ncbi:hypothetical protein [Pseudoduganella violacea]|uniref:Uncharacterized protein n=1 Tax=Pseudoduganella violacea TaxID=1715466 RepID=A0A7W5BE56_9BURK|nr:hypothetical protein [Pseudoduganella violacea]MBB3121516.1 hypothetical protein [Pseudoduganella violacea]
MLRLWPERVRIGWFPGRCLLAGGEQAAVELDSGMTPSSLLAGMDALLAMRKPGPRRRAILDIVLSDSAAELVRLPWQPTVQGPQALRMYAMAAFSRQGQAIGEAHAVQTAYRYYGMDGIAYAVPSEWLEALAQGLLAQGLELGSVLPLSVDTYWRRKTAIAGRTLVLLQEPNRLTLHTYQGRQLLMLDAEAVAGPAEQACLRLLRRAAIAEAADSEICYWPAGTLPDLAAPIQSCLDGIAMRRLSWHSRSWA